MSRRQFAARIGAASAGIAGGLLPPWRGIARAEPSIPLWMADIDGDGQLTDRDEQILMDTLGSRRGFELAPAPGYDHRADLLGRALVNERDLDLFRSIRGSAPGGMPPRRPITVAWHYGWYHRRKRTAATSGFLGGDYLSDDPAVETTFNRLKNELGVTVDALSWISPRLDPRIESNLRRGYLQARNLRSRHVGLLYESWINLPRTTERIDFASLDVRGRLVEDFGMMGAFLRSTEAAGGRVFVLDNRPVIFLFASHSWVNDPTSTFQFRALDDAMEVAIARFAAEYGTAPFLVGEELPLAPGDEFGADRLRRSLNFDALFTYHHAASPENIIHGGSKLGQSYARAQQGLLQGAAQATASLVNRFTGRPLLIVPSLAAGFAKPGFRKLWVSRVSYANYLREMHEYIQREGITLGTEVRRAQPSVYSVGSWNEEFEGHALFPYSFNRTVRRTQAGGFDLALALKEVLGWNRYAFRPLS